MMLVLACILLVLLFILPFAAGIREFRKKHDAAPLYINMDYHKDPRYFACSFRKLFFDSLEETAAKEGPRDLTLSKKEKVQIIGDARFVDGSLVENVLYVIQNLDSGKNVRFEKEIYVRSNARIGMDNQLQALACDGDIHILKGTRFFRWLDAEGAITVEEQCNLGIDATCGKKLSVAPACSFMRLYGFPVTTGGSTALAQKDADLRNVSSLVLEDETIERNLSAVPPFSRKDCTIITSHSLTIGDHAVIRGHIKTHANLLIGAFVAILGNLFAEGDIEIGQHSLVLGTVFSQGHVRCKQGVRVGAQDRIKSVIGKKSVTLESGVTVHGYIMTEGRGVVV